MEAETAEEAKHLSKTESCDQRPVINLQMPASRNLIYFAVNRNINQCERLMRGLGAAKIRTLTRAVQPSVFAEGMLR